MVGTTASIHYAYTFARARVHIRKRAPRVLECVSRGQPLCAYTVASARAARLRICVWGITSMRVHMPTVSRIYAYTFARILEGPVCVHAILFRPTSSWTFSRSGGSSLSFRVSGGCLMLFGYVVFLFKFVVDGWPHFGGRLWPVRRASVLLVPF